MAPEPPGAGGGRLLPALEGFDRLDSVRTAPSATAGRLVFGVPTDVTVTDAARISRLAHAVCALPRAPSGHAAIACPADYGVAYHVRFEAAHAPPATVVLHTSGCEFVTGLTRERWVRKSGFWSTLAWVLGANPPVAAAVTGH